jgi:ribosomal protein S18 acetylase RimI-like enzyme
MSSAYTIRLIRDEDTGAVQRLWSDRFGGPDDRISNWIQATLNDRYRTTGHVAVPSRSADEDGGGDEGDSESADGGDGPVVAFGMLEVGTRDYTRSYLGLDEIDGFDLELDDRNGIMHMYCVDRDWEGRGIATALYRRHLQHFREKGVRRAFGISWHRPRREGADSRVVFEKTGFEPAGTFEEFYARASPRQDCPDCGGHCHCTATIYEITLDGDETGDST